MDRRASNDEEDGDICEPLPECFPAELRGMPLRVTAGLVLTEYNCMYSKFNDDFGVSSVEQAIRNLIRCADVNLVYGFALSGATPHFKVDADWPLFRRRKNSGFERRPLVSTGAPWNEVADRTVFELRNEPITVFTARLYLRVGGRDREDATRRCEPPRILRRLLRLRMEPTCGSPRSFPPR